MKILFLLCLLLCGCSRQSYEMEELSKDVLKSKVGVEIEVKPIAKDQ